MNTLRGVTIRVSSFLPNSKNYKNNRKRLFLFVIITHDLTACFLLSAYQDTKKYYPFFDFDISHWVTTLN